MGRWAIARANEPASSAAGPADRRHPGRIVGTGPDARQQPTRATHLRVPAQVLATGPDACEQPVRAAALRVPAQLVATGPGTQRGSPARGARAGAPVPAAIG